MQESQPQIQQESYTVSYTSSSGANGHHDADDASSSGGGSAANNQHSSQVSSAENAQLISRTTQQMKTQQVIHLHLIIFFSIINLKIFPTFRF
jgi:hypothetical protein